MDTNVEIELIKNKLEQHDDSLDRLGSIAESLREIVIEHKIKFVRADEIHQELKINTAGRFEVLKEDLKQEITNTSATINTKLDGVIDSITGIDGIKDMIKGHGDRLTSLERYKWIIFGGATFIGFMVKFIFDWAEPIHEIITKSPH